MPDGIQILGVYTHVTDCRGKEVERMGILRAATLASLWQVIFYFK